MRWVPLLPVAGMLIIIAAFSGCVGTAVESSYEDADDRVGKSFAGGHNEQKTFNVPAGTNALRVAVNVEVSGGWNLQLMGPAMTMKAQMNQGGVFSTQDESWYRESDPMPGQWMLQISAGGSGAFAVGAYLE